MKAALALGLGLIAMAISLTIFSTQVSDQPLAKKAKAEASERAPHDPDRIPLLFVPATILIVYGAVRMATDRIKS